MRHDEGVDGHALARAGRAGDQQVRHGVQLGGHDAAVDVLAHGQRDLRLRAEELLRLDHLAQPDGFALVVRHLDADRGLARHALDENAFGAQRQAEIVAQAGDAAVLDAGFGLELEGRDHRAGIDLHHLAAHVELAALFRQHLRQVLQLEFVDGAVLVGTVQQRGRRQLVAAGQARHRGLAARRAVGARGDGDVFRLGHRLRSIRRMGGRSLRRLVAFALEHPLDAAPRFAALSLRQRSWYGGRLRRRSGWLLCRATAGTSCAVTTGLALAAAARFFSSSFAALLASALGAPVGKAIERGIDKGEARLRPDLDRAERKRRRKIKRHGDDRQANQVSADEIEVVNQRVGDDAAQQAFGRDGALPANGPGQQSDEPGEEREQRNRAQRLGVRRADGPRAEPAQRVQHQENRDQENRNAEELQRKIADDGPEHADPVVRRAPGGRIRRGVQRGIERRIRNQCEDKEDREDEHQEADQLIEPPVGRRSKCARNVHFGVRTYR